MPRKRTEPAPVATAEELVTPEAPKSKLGRKTDFTPELGLRVVKLVQAGNYMETAAAAVGLCKDTLYRWLKEGARQERKGKRTALAEWADQMHLASARAEAGNMLIIGAAAKRGQWQAAAWRLERLYPDKYGRRRFEVSGPAGAPIPFAGKVEVKHHVPDPAAVSAIVDILRRAGVAPVDDPGPGVGPGDPAP